MALSGALTNSLRKAEGFVVFLGSVSGQERAPLGASYAATKAGLGRFSENYFQENRKHGVRVLHLAPGMTDTPFYDGERFRPKQGNDFAVETQALADLVQFFFRGPGKTSNPTHLTIEPKMVGVEKVKPS
jgi:short-subunit dehydrogenase